MSYKGYNYDFKMMLEGVETPFKSANIICTPNGVEASINIHPNEQAFQLKPKTAVQIFFKEWVRFTDKEPAWRLFFDGFFSRYDKGDDARGGRGLSILCRDFRMDIRRTAAFMLYDDGKLTIDDYGYHEGGLRLGQGSVYPGTNTRINLEARKFSETGKLLDSIRVINSIAGAGLGTFRSFVDSEDPYNYNVSTQFPLDENVLGIDKAADGAFFLDAFVRGVWYEAVGGTPHGSFLNHRIRADKRFVVPRNSAGYSIFQIQNFGAFTGASLLGNSRYTSIEAAIMRVAGLFMTRVYSCNSPAIIDISDDSPANQFIIAEKSREYFTKKKKDYFGHPNILSESLLLPPLEFTAPPNCNLLFPCMYDRIMWQYDQDVDITRGYFKTFNMSPNSINEYGPLKKFTFNVPNTLFAAGNTPTLTIEERYKGMNIMTGNVAHDLAQDELAKIIPEMVFRADKAAKLKSEKEEMESDLKNTKNNVSQSDEMIKAKSTPGGATKINKMLKEKRGAIKGMKKLKDKDGNEESEKEMGVRYIMKRHAVFKFINSKFAGRVATIDMCFNPYVMCGFPGAVIADTNNNSYKTQKSMVGMVQQVKHLVVIDAQGGNASTTVVMNNVRFRDESTDISIDGSPFYMPVTVPEDAEVDPDTLEHVKTEKGSYFAADPRVHYALKKTDNDIYDLEDLGTKSNYPYAKDILVQTKAQVDTNQINTRYLDDIYAPNNISKFYKDVFGQKNHFMMGTKQTKRDGQPYKLRYMYDSIDEAITKLITAPENAKYLYNYEEAMKYTYRNICSEEAFYMCILGLSKKVLNEDGSYEYVNVPYNKTIASEHHDEYFGITTKKFEKDIKDKDKYMLDGKNTYKSGSFSSILEKRPLTAFIRERKVAAKAYADSLKRQVHGVALVDE